jgi:hypothetical protein
MEVKVSMQETDTSISYRVQYETTLEGYDLVLTALVFLSPFNRCHGYVPDPAYRAGSDAMSKEGERPV